MIENADIDSLKKWIELNNSPIENDGADLTKAGLSNIDLVSLERWLILNNFVTTPLLSDKEGADGFINKIAGIPVNRIAMCDENDTTNTTIRNALNLGGHAPDYFLTSEKGKGILESAINIANIYNKEITDLRDEVYQLREELAKSGVATGYAPYAGFYDMFRSNQPVHENGVIATVVEDSENNYELIVDEFAFAKFYVGERVYVESKNTKGISTCRIIEKLDDGKTLVLDTSPGFQIVAGEVRIYKSRGNIINGTFTFGEISPMRPGVKEFYSCLDDDTYRSRREIKESNAGFAYSFRIPAIYQKNYLSKIDIQVKKYGNPGNLMCYVIDERDLPKWKNADQAIADNDKTSKKYDDTKFNFFAKSKPLFIDAEKGEYLAHFDFYDESASDLIRVESGDLTQAEVESLTEEDRIKLTEQGYLMRANNSSYPLMYDTDSTDHKVRYVMIIEATRADAVNYYQVLFLQHIDKDSDNPVDLQLNNTVYKYKQIDTNAPKDESAFITNAAINESDMYYGITMVEAVQEAFEPYVDGQYSAKFVTDHPVYPDKARATLRIRREGMYTIDAQGTEIQKGGDMSNNSTIRVLGPEEGFYNAENVVIGTSLRGIVRAQNRVMVIDKGFHLNGDEIVYPMSYKVYMNAVLKEWDEENCKTVVKDAGRFEMKASHVMHDLYKKNINTSDRIVFEVDFKDEKGSNRKFNEFEIQVEWDKNARDISVDNVGQIHDIVLSLGRRFNEAG